jgi:hypothetical protein
MSASSDPNLICERVLTAAVSAAGLLLLAIGAVGIWAFSETSNLRTEMVSNHIDAQREISALENRITAAYIKECIGSER